jgi:hypothetical protein
MAWGVRQGSLPHRPPPVPVDYVDVVCVTCRGTQRAPRKAARAPLTLLPCRWCGGQRYFKRVAPPEAGPG